MVERLDHRTSVETWFADALTATVMLPDGWFGRPYDNQHRLTSVHEGADQLVICLDANVLLTVRGLQGTRIAAHDLILGPFEHLTFEWHAFGAPVTQRSFRRRVYSSGAVRLVRTPGT